MQNIGAETVDDYLSAFPAEIRIRLEQIRKVILKAAPEAREGISFYIPAYRYHGKLVRFAAYDRHIGFYPGAGAIQAFKTALAPYVCSKGAVHLPLHGPLPLKLLREMILFRVKENMEKQDLKSMTSIAGKKKKTCPRGHVFNKSSDCPVCPVCASLARPREGFLSKISAPARRALEAKGILELSQLSKYTEQEILSLHGIGNKAMIELRLALEEKGLRFKAAGGPVSAEKA
ncbi:MAG TPA: DUF1801 domain-containing protein [Saprospiraceae bacterium]|nr:DUF1801 domain-containing protein [Saprospiraceae bacterium]HNT22664.1 DUF1801 domain-containing protein [Saprospiraceae bacterium]